MFAEFSVEQRRLEANYDVNPEAKEVQHMVSVKGKAQHVTPHTIVNNIWLLIIDEPPLYVY